MNMVERYFMACEQAGRPDVQAETYYDWEDYHRPFSLLLEEELTWQECKEMVARVWAAYTHTLPPVLKSLPPCAGASAACRQYIKLAPHHRNAAYVLHETAHALLYLRWPVSYRADKGRMEGHGPEFARIHAEIVNAEYNIPMSTIVASMRKKGIKIAFRHEVPRPLKERR